MKEYLFTIHLVGNDKNGNALVHVYAAWKYKEKQAKALVLVVPKEVDDKMYELFPYAKVTRTNVACNEHAYNSGVNDGRNAMRTPAIG